MINMHNSCKIDTKVFANFVVDQMKIFSKILPRVAFVQLLSDS